jgi:uncharacterized protein YyaL (SSP411 family)
MMTGHGGWPMTVFLTPTGEPFYGGTYFPPEPRHGMPGSARCCASHDAWRTSAAPTWTRAPPSSRARCARAARSRPTPEPLDPSMLDNRVPQLVRRFDPRHGGFGGAPKFPQAMNLELPAAHWRRTGAPRRALEMADAHAADGRRAGCTTTWAAASRATADARWLVPHFEKMLYDNALLARAYLHAWQATGEAEHRRVVEETLDWVTREMTARRAASTPRSTPTARARRGSSTSGTRSTRGSARPTARSSASAST